MTDKPVHPKILAPLHKHDCNVKVEELPGRWRLTVNSEDGTYPDELHSDILAQNCRIIGIDTKGPLKLIVEYTDKTAQTMPDENSVADD